VKVRATKENDKGKQCRNVMAMVVAVVVTMIVVAMMMTTKMNKRKEKKNEVEYTAKVKTAGLRVKEEKEEE
jgi:uncharacterized membrane protein